MDSLDLIQTFREVARRGSFSAAARALDLSPASVSKYIAALEARFGVRLFHRTTRKVSLTDAGQLLYERSGPVLERALAGEFGGLPHFQLPNADRALKAARNARIVSDYAKKSARQIALEQRLTEGQVVRILSKAGASPPVDKSQRQLF